MVPPANCAPDARVQSTTTGGAPPAAVGAGNVTGCAPPAAVILAGHVIAGPVGFGVGPFGPWLQPPAMSKTAPTASP